MCTVLTHRTAAGSTHTVLNEIPDHFLLFVTQYSFRHDADSDVASCPKRGPLILRVTPGIGTSGGETSADGGSLSATGRAARCTERENGIERGTTGGERAHEDAVAAGVAVAAAAGGRAETESRDEVSDEQSREAAF